MIIALTGSFCSGKTTVGSILRRQGLEVIDIDKIYDNILRTSASLRRKLTKLWGESAKMRRIDKKILSEIVLTHPQGLEKISSITHPYIITELRRLVAKYRRERKKTKVVIFEVPLLFEKGLDKLFDITILVWSPKYILIQRGKQRGYRYSEILRILSHQMSSREKKKRCDYVIKNNGSREELKNKVEEIFKKITNQEVFYGY